MTTARNRTIALLVCLSFVAAGCSRAEPSTPTATLGAAPSPTEVPTSEPAEATDPPDPYAIPKDPKDIDAAYVEKVLEKLSESIARATRIVAAEDAVTPAVVEALESSHRGPALPGIVGAFREALNRGPATRYFSKRATRADIEVRKIISASRRCIFTLVMQDPSSLGKQEVDAFPTYYQLGRKRPASDPVGENPTPWMVVADGEPLANGKEYANPCEG